MKRLIKWQSGISKIKPSIPVSYLKTLLRNVDKNMFQT
jgi:hypothetical protein